MSYPAVITKAFELGKKELKLSKVAVQVLGVSAFIVATIAGAFIRIPLPFTPVPITLQTFFVLLAGAVLGRKLGSLSQAGYLILGAAGLPIFSGALGGVSRLFGPTGGYLFGFVVAAWFVGLMLRRDKESFFKIALTMALGSLIIYVLGAVWLNFIVKIGISKAILLGVLPFVPGDIIKLLAAASVYHSIQSRTRQIYTNT